MEKKEVSKNISIKWFRSVCDKSIWYFPSKQIFLLTLSKDCDELRRSVYIRNLDQK